jgi:hypothetical protein
MLVEPGRCHTCSEQVKALDRIAAERARPSPKLVAIKHTVGGFVRGVMTFAALALLVYVLFNFVSMFADWWALGGRPWQ